MLAKPSVETAEKDLIGEDYLCTRMCVRERERDSRPLSAMLFETAQAKHN